MLRSGAPFLSKPFSPDVLVRKLREVLDYRLPFAKRRAPVAITRLALATA